MTRFKKTTALLMALCLIFSLAACSGDKDKFESVREFEFHFYPEEFEEEYSEVSKTLTLDVDTDYQLQLDALCESGTMEIAIVYGDSTEVVYSVNGDSPCCETLEFPANTAEKIKINVSIHPDTKGKFIGILFSIE